MAEYIESFVETVTTRYGHRVLESHPMVKVTDGEMFVSDKKIVDYDPELFKESVPVRLVARWKYDPGNGVTYARFICGVDLLDDGTIWSSITGRAYSSAEECWQVIREKEMVEDFDLFLEEPLEIPR